MLPTLNRSTFFSAGWVREPDSEPDASGMAASYEQIDCRWNQTGYPSYSSRC